MKVLALFSILIGMTSAGSQVNRYFDALIEYGIYRQDTFCQRIISKLLEGVRDHNWAGLILDIDIVLKDIEKARIKSEFREILNRHPRLAKKSHSRVPMIPNFVHNRYRWAYKILLTLITKCELDEFWDLFAFLDDLVYELSKRRELDRRSRIFFVKLRRSIKRL